MNTETKTSFLAALAAQANKGKTANGGETNRSSNSELLDFFALGGALRGKDAEALSLYIRAHAENAGIANRILFYFRDPRQGQGERSVFRTCFKWLATNYPHEAEANLHLVPELGRWDDLFELEGTAVWPAVVKMCKETYLNDNPSKPSLFWKWLPTVGASNKERAHLAKKFARLFAGNERDYRKTVSARRKTLDVVERKMCAKEWGEINYPAVPSRAAMLYSDAFKKHDEARYQRFKDAVTKGEAKVNAGTLTPVDVVCRITKPLADVQNLENLWKALPDFAPEGEHNAICVADVSGSMESQIGTSKMKAIDVSTSLAIYCAQRLKGPFHNTFITFSKRPVLHKVYDSLKASVDAMRSLLLIENTNVDAVFELILSTAVANKVAPEDLPKTLIIVSDMEFDACAEGIGAKTQFEHSKRRFAAHGYALPNIVFWNVMARVGNIPATKHDRGVALVSGFSPAILKSVLSNKEITPLDVMHDTVCKERYAKVFPWLG